MLDCEMSGLDPKVDDLLQIAAMKLEFDGVRYNEVDEINIFVHSDKTPNSAFALEHMTEVYRKSNESTVTLEMARTLLLGFLQDWAGNVSPCGDCVPTDILFLYEKGVVNLAGFNGDTPVPGTFNLGGTHECR